MCTQSLIGTTCEVKFLLSLLADQIITYPVIIKFCVSSTIGSQILQ